MNLNQYAAEKRLALLDDLRKGLPPREGTYDADVLKDAKTKGTPQMGTTRYTPSEIVFEFIYPDPHGTAIVFEVTQTPPERIVFMPVPAWVIENIWQGDISDTHHFEPDAMRLVEELGAELSPNANLKWFERQSAKRRE